MGLWGGLWENIMIILIDMEKTSCVEEHSMFIYLFLNFN